MDHEGTEFYVNLVWFGLHSNHPIHKEKQLSIKKLWEQLLTML